MGAQDAIVAAIVLAAVAWLVARAWRRRRSAGCACGDCPASKAAIAAVARAQAPGSAGPSGLVHIEPSPRG